MGEEDKDLFHRPQRGTIEVKAEHGTSAELECQRRYADLFEQLDLNRDGRVDISELRIGLAARGLHQGEAEEVRP